VLLVLLGEQSRRMECCCLEVDSLPGKLRVIRGNWCKDEKGGRDCQVFKLVRGVVKIAFVKIRQ
jgi:hypothetical protein